MRKYQLKGLVSRLSEKGAEIELEEPLELLTNIKMNLGDMPGELASRDSYGKGDRICRQYQDSVQIHRPVHFHLSRGFSLFSGAPAIRG